MIPERLIDDRQMLAGIARACVDRLAKIEPVAEQLVEEALVDRLATLVQRTVCHQFPGQQCHRSEFNKPLKHIPDRRGFGLVDHQLAVDDIVPHRHESAHPNALRAAGSELVADAFAGDLAIELGERQQDIQRKPNKPRPLADRLFS
ncbi:MAG: hypothetical protein V4579_13825 [Pseudomonadota bacterium]